MKNTLILFIGLLVLGIVSHAQKLGPQRPTPLSNHHIGNDLMAAKPATVSDCPGVGMEYHWNDSLGTWEHFRRYVYSYWPDGFMMEERTEIWNGNSYTPEGRTLTEFDGVVWGSAWYSWQGNAWEPADSYATTFDAQLVPLYSYTFQKIQGQWDTVYGQRKIHVPNPTQPLYTDDEVWSSNNPVWTLQNRAEYHYSIPTEWDTATYYRAVGTLLFPDYRQIVQQWQDFHANKYVKSTFQEYLGNNWTTTLRDSMFHGLYGSYVSVAASSIDGINWNDPARFEVAYDSLRHQTLALSQNWINGSWVTDFGMSFDYVYDPQWRRERVYHSGYGNGGFVLAKRIDFLSQVTALDEEIANAVVASTYPNPCTEVVHFQLDSKVHGAVSVQLYDLQGRLRVATASQVTPGQSLDLPLSRQLEGGTYCYRLQYRGGVATGKIVVAR